MSCDGVWTRRVMSCHVMGHVMSCHVMSWVMSWVMSCDVISSVCLCITIPSTQCHDEAESMTKSDQECVCAVPAWFTILLTSLIILVSCLNPQPSPPSSFLCGSLVWESCVAVLCGSVLRTARALDGVLSTPSGATTPTLQVTHSM